MSTRNVVRLKALERESRRLLVSPQAGEPGRYRVGSASRPGVTYEVTVDADSLGGACSCPWSLYGGVNCKHVLAVLRRHYADAGRLSFWRSRQDAGRQHRPIISGKSLIATLRRPA